MQMERVRERVVGEAGEKLGGGIGMDEGGRMDMGAGKYISQIRKPF